MGRFAITLRFMTSRQHVFRLWCHACNLLYITWSQKQVTDVSLVLKDSDMDSENLSSLIRLSVSDSQKRDSSKVISVIGIIKKKIPIVDQSLATGFIPINTLQQRASLTF